MSCQFVYGTANGLVLPPPSERCPWNMTKCANRNKSRPLFSSAKMFKKPLWQTVWTQIRFLAHAVCFYTQFISNVRQLLAADDFSFFRCICFIGALRVKSSVLVTAQLLIEIVNILRWVFLIRISTAYILVDSESALCLKPNASQVLQVLSMCLHVQGGGGVVEFIKNQICS